MKLSSTVIPPNLVGNTHLHTDMPPLYDFPATTPSPEPVPRPGPLRSLVRTAVVLALGALVASGCNRAQYRLKADRDAYGLIDCGSTDPRWPLDDYTIQPDPRSRFFDPYSPDHPPMPPDDPTSHLLMHCVDCKHGWPWEHHYGLTPHVESPVWERELGAYLPMNEEGAFVLNRESAVTVALIHSRTYQRELEDLYLSALGVSLERFQFHTQFFGDTSAFFDVDGPLHGDAPSSSTLDRDVRVGASKLFAAGGQLTTEVANRVVWQFSGEGGRTITTPISFAFLQPLLRSAGRAVVLEDLTNSERALLANIRQMERFRRGFYVDTVAGRSPGLGPATGAITLGNLTVTSGGGIGGYLQLLQQQLEIRNQQANVVALRNSLERLDAFLKTGQTTPTIADQTRQSLYSSQIDLLLRRTSYQEQLDSYKIELGLPPRLEVEVEDPLLEPFNLIAPVLTNTQNTLTETLDPVREGAAAVGDALEATQARQRTMQAAEATRVMFRVAEAAAEAIDAVGEGDFTRAGKAVSRAASLAQAAQTAAEAAAAAAAALREPEGAEGAVDPSRDVERAQATAALAAVEAAGAEDRAKAARVAAEAVAQAAAAIEAAAADPDSDAGLRAQATAAAANAATKAAEAAARATVEVATQTARAAVKAAQAAQVDEPVAEADDLAAQVAQAARAASTSVDWAELGDYSKAAESTLQATDQATRMINAAIQRAPTGDYVRAAEAAARASEAVKAAKAMRTAELSEYSNAVEAAVAATMEAAEAVLAATTPEDTAQAALQAAARASLAAVEAALATAKAEETAQVAANAAKTATQPADYADELARSVLAAVDAGLAASKADEIAAAASRAAQAAAAAATDVVLQGPAPVALAEAVSALRAQPDDQQMSILDASRDHVALVQQDVEKLQEVREDRSRQLEELAERPEFGFGEVDPGVADVGALNQRVIELCVSFHGKSAPEVGSLTGELLTTSADWIWFDGLTDVDGLANELHATLDELDQLPQNATQLAEAAGNDLAAWHRLLRSFRDPLDRLSEQLADLSLVQARARLDTTTLTPVDIEWSEALQIARVNRRDWMNARAALVDRWRQVEIAANELKSDLSVTVEGDITPSSDTTSSSINNTTGNLTVGFQFDAPLNRRAERNAYRSTLIEYQRARRDYYAYEDQVARSIRETIRLIDLAPLQFEIQRAAVQLAITRAERETYLLRLGRAQGPTAARDIVDAFRDLLNAQNSFLRAWLEYEIQRMSLDFDMGTMQLDHRGIWVDPGTITGPGRSPVEEYETIPLGPEAAPGAWPMLDLIPPVVDPEPIPSANLLGPELAPDARPIPDFIPPVVDQEPTPLAEVHNLPSAHRVDRPTRNVAHWLRRPYQPQSTVPVTVEPQTAHR